MSPTHPYKSSFGSMKISLVEHHSMSGILVFMCLYHLFLLCVVNLFTSLIAFQHQPRQLWWQDLPQAMMSPSTTFSPFTTICCQLQLALQEATRTPDYPYEGLSSSWTLLSRWRSPDFSKFVWIFWQAFKLLQSLSGQLDRPPKMGQNHQKSPKRLPVRNSLDSLAVK
jgi:hypothetical protein